MDTHHPLNWERKINAPDNVYSLIKTVNKKPIYFLCICKAIIFGIKWTQKYAQRYIDDQESVRKQWNTVKLQPAKMIIINACLSPSEFHLAFSLSYHPMLSFPQYAIDPSFPLHGEAIKNIPAQLKSLLGYTKSQIRIEVEFVFVKSKTFSLINMHAYFPFSHFQ